MKYFLEPIYLTDWNIFSEVCSFSYEENFYATKEMEIGNMVFFYVTKNNEDKILSGIYGNSIVINSPYINKNDRYVVDIKIKYIRFDEPILDFDICMKYLKQVSSVHRIEDAIMVELMKTNLARIL